MDRLTLAPRSGLTNHVPMHTDFLIYGATGYSARLVLGECLARGLRPILAARPSARLAALEAETDLECRAASLDDPDELDECLKGVRAVLHSAGPFSRTWRPMVEACLRNRVHYLDLTAEVRSIEAVAEFDRAARDRAIMLMPAVGFEVVPSDCLVSYVVARVPAATTLHIGSIPMRFATQASTRTLSEAANFQMQRRQGRLERLPFGSQQYAFDFGVGPSVGLNVSNADLATAYYSCGLQNITTYFQALPGVQMMLSAGRGFGWALQSGVAQALIKTWTDFLPSDPEISTGGAQRLSIVADVSNARGERAVSRLRTPEAYAFTGVAAAAVVERVLAGDLQTGFQTPARVFGSEFVMSLPGVSREDLQ